MTIKEMVLTVSVYKTMYQFCHPMPGEAGEMTESTFMPIPMNYSKSRSRPLSLSDDIRLKWFVMKARAQGLFNLRGNDRRVMEQPNFKTWWGKRHSYSKMWMLKVLVVTC
jgi:hypothetical protein